MLPAELVQAVQRPSLRNVIRGHAAARQMSEADARLDVVNSVFALAARTTSRGRDIGRQGGRSLGQGRFDGVALVARPQGLQQVSQDLDGLVVAPHAVQGHGHLVQVPHGALVVIDLERHAQGVGEVANRKAVLFPEAQDEAQLVKRKRLAPPIADLLAGADLREVILVGHSYGGMIITGLAERMPARMGHLIYLDAVAPIGAERSVQELFQRHRPDTWRDLATDIATRGDGWRIPVPTGEPILGVTDPADLRWLRAHLTDHTLADRRIHAARLDKQRWVDEVTKAIIDHFNQQQPTSQTSP